MFFFTVNMGGPVDSIFNKDGARCLSVYFNR